MKKITIRYTNAVRGIVYAVKNDKSYRSNIYLFGIIIIGIFIYFDPLAMWEVLFTALAYTLVLITELQNSALEAALDRMHPEMHDMIGHSKDMAAGAVLTAGVFLLIVVGVLFLGRI
jgi:diacylglycerol kinase